MKILVQTRKILHCGLARRRNVRHSTRGKGSCPWISATRNLPKPIVFFSIHNPDKENPPSAIKKWRFVCVLVASLWFWPNPFTKWASRYLPRDYQSIWGLCLLLQPSPRLLGVFGLWLQRWIHMKAPLISLNAWNKLG